MVACCICHAGCSAASTAFWKAELTCCITFRSVHRTASCVAVLLKRPRRTVRHFSLNLSVCCVLGRGSVLPAGVHTHDVRCTAYLPGMLYFLKSSLSYISLNWVNLVAFLLSVHTCTCVHARDSRGQRGWRRRATRLDGTTDCPHSGILIP